MGLSIAFCNRETRLQGTFSWGGFPAKNFKSKHVRRKIIIVQHRWKLTMVWNKQ